MQSETLDEPAQPSTPRPVHLHGPYSTPDDRYLADKG